MVLTCLPSMTYEELSLYNYTVEQLNAITSIIVNGRNDSSPGPFTSIPPNICMLPNLQVSERVKISVNIVQMRKFLEY